MSEQSLAMSFQDFQWVSRREGSESAVRCCVLYARVHIHCARRRAQLLYILELLRADLIWSGLAAARFRRRSCVNTAAARAWAKRRVPARSQSAQPNDNLHCTSRILTHIHTRTHTERNAGRPLALLYRFAVILPSRRTTRYPPPRAGKHTAESLVEPQ